VEPASLRSIPLFEHVGDDMLARIAERGTEFEAAAGHVLIEVGQPGAGLFVIEEGTVSVELPRGRRIELGAGEFVGDLALLTDHPHAARVRAATPVRCVAISRADFAELLRSEPQVAVDMLPVLARRLTASL
jgi:voltage-gated potassium channel